MSSDLQGALLSPWALGLLGLCIGSFLNVVIHRLPQMMERAWRLESAELLGVAAPESPALTLAKPASRCPQCGHRIRWFENVPVLSWLLLRGRCSACKTPISPRYPLFEIATGLLFALLAWRFGAQPTVLAWCAFVAVLLALSGIDWDTTLLPDSLTLPLLWAGLVAAALGWTLPLSTAVWGAVFGYLSLWSVYWLFKLTTGKEGMGAGDFKLLAALGAWLGWQMLLPIVLGASLIGAAVGIAMKLSGALHEGRYVPFGPFLAGAGLVVLYAGSERVMGWLGWA
ncbi:prepilin peptidase [Methylibium sp. Pch-M]|uniref:prepilin peptidase n=1 Tax=Methylibium sp. Pch-M TaxID=2082386 RepID=UPI00101025F9|nr:A24 family peptidase [Methylibium sp. Pch-M]QAZ40030.1 prepilin peptidase [Methylibium sp. Pch-M]